MVLLHIFDMDHTLIEADCDVTWKQFLVSEGLAPASALAEADRFFDQYNRGCLDHDEFNAFQLREIAGLGLEEMADISRRHFEKMILPNIRPAAEAYVKSCQASGIPCVILSSTNAMLVAPVAHYLGITEFYGSPLEMYNGRFTGKIAGGLFAGEGKVGVMKQLCAKYALTPASVAAYGDSINDAKLLAAVGTACAVSPSDALHELAVSNNWRILDWRA
ncbi:MAG: HAD-IB family hydrolase [Lentisphaeria bacterium]|nr:HAD-IB family hydrolase [Lentisphaeria bacterium]